MKVTTIHGPGTTLGLLAFGGLTGWFALTILGNNPTDEDIWWGMAACVFSLLSFYSGFKGRS